MWTCPIAVAIARAVAPLPALQEFPPVLGVGDTVRGTLPAGPDDPRRVCDFELLVEDEGPVLVAASSVDFDVALSVWSPGGVGPDAGERPAGHDSDSGPGLDARLVVRGPGAIPLRVRSEGRDGGAFTVRATRGDPGPPQATDELAAFAAWLGAEHCPADAEAACVKLVDGLAEELRAAGRDAEAGRALALFERVAEGRVDAPTWNRGQCLLGYLAQRRGDVDAARERFEAQLARLDEQRPRMDLFVLDRLASIYQDEGRFEDAAALQRDAVDRARAQGERGVAAMSLSRVGRAEADLGRADAARAAFEGALAELRHAPPHPVYRARTTLNAAAFFTDRGELARARELLEELIAWDALRPPHAIEARSRLTVLCRIEGRHDELVTHRTALESLLTHASTSTAQRLDATLTLAQCALRLGDVDEGMRIVDRLLREPALDEATRIEALRTRSALWEISGRLAPALADADAAVERSAEAGDPGREAASRAMRGRVHALLEDWEAAREDFALARTAAQELDDALLAAACDVGTAVVHLWTGEVGAAETILGSATAELRRIGAREYLLYALEIAAEAAIAAGDAPAARGALDEAVATFEGAAWRSLGHRDATAVRSRFWTWAQVAQDVTVLEEELAAGAADRARAVEEGFEQASLWKGRALFEGLARHAQGAADAPVTPSDLAPALGREWRLVELAAGREHLFAYVVDGSRLVRHDLGPRAELEELAAAYVDGISGAGALFDPAAIAASGGELYRRLLAPVIGDDDRGLVVIPTPELARLPFGALVSAVRGDGERFADLTFVLEERPVVLAPSSPILVSLAVRPPRPDRGRVLLLGDPLFPDEAGAPASSRVGSLRRLPGSRDEVLALARRLGGGRPPFAPAERSAAWSAPRFDLYLGERASLAPLGADLTGYGIVHCATHGLVDASDPALTGLVLSSGGDDDGVLGLAEVRALDLDAELVVLSACDTAAGRVLRGDGVQSLAHAFLEGGSRGVVATLWRVDDDVARELVEDFYRGMLEDGSSPPEALRAAQLAVRRAPAEEFALANAHPYLWAPFVYVGRLP